MVAPREVTLTGHGGDPVRALRCAPEGEGPFPALVVAHEVFGCDRFASDVAARLAAAGYVAIVPDLYSREGVPGPRSTDADPGPAWTVDQIRAAAAGLPDRRAVADLEAAAAALAADDVVDPDRIGAIGFCLGGKLAFLLGCQSRRLAGVVDVYGRIRYADLDANHPVQPLEMALGLECPLLGLFAGDDASIPPEDVDAMRQQLDAFAKPNQIEVVPDVGHGFLNPPRGAFSAPAADEAWRTIQTFLEEYL